METLSKEEKVEIQKKIQDLKSELANERKILQEVSAAKEKAFQEKESLKTSLMSIITKIKELRGTSDPHAADALRKERDKYNAQVREIIEKIKVLRKEAQPPTSKTGKRISLSRVKSDIDRLEESIEIEAFEYTQEQKVLDKIKKLKKEYSLHTQSQEVLNQIRDLSNTLEELKKHADLAHGQLTEKINASRDQFKEYRGLSKELAKIKKEQEAAWDHFIVKKNEFSKLHKEVKRKMMLLKDLEGKVHADFRSMKYAKEKQQKDLIREKARSVEEKLKKSGKLTTEDLIVIQGAE